MLLADCPDLNLGQFLQQQRTNHVKTAEEDPLFLPRPYGMHIIGFLNLIMTAVEKNWLQFVIKYESELSSSGVSTFAAKTVIYCVYQMGPIQTDVKCWQGINTTDLSFQAASEAIRHTFEAKQLLLSFKNTLKWSSQLMCRVVPQFVYREVLCIFRDEHAESKLIQFLLSVSGLLVEIWIVITMAATGPLCVLEILFDRKRFGRNALQTVCVQGRKRLAWSNVDGLTQEGKVSTCVSLRAIGFSLRHLLEQLMLKDGETKMPNKCAVAVTTTSWDSLLED